MKTGNRLTLVSFILAQFVFVFPAASSPELACGDTITADTTLTEDLVCPADAEYAIVIGAPNITLDLGGHIISGHTPNTGVFSLEQEGITIRNGVIQGFNVGIFVIQANLATMENLTVRNLDISDPDHMIFGIAIDSSQNVLVRDSYFEFITSPAQAFLDVRGFAVQDVGGLQGLIGLPEIGSLGWTRQGAQHSQHAGVLSRSFTNPELMKKTLESGGYRRI